MSQRIQIIIVVAMCACVAQIIRLLARKTLDYKLGIIWSLVFMAIAVLSLVPNTLARIAAFVGIASPVNMLFFFGFIFSTGILFVLSRRTALLQAQVRRLAQESAIANVTDKNS